MPLLILPSFCNETIWVIVIDDKFLQVGGYVYALWAIRQGCLRCMCLMIFCFRDSVSELAQFGFVSVTEGLRQVEGSLGLLSGADCQYVCTWSLPKTDSNWYGNKNNYGEFYVNKPILLILVLEFFMWLL